MSDSLLVSGGTTAHTVFGLTRPVTHVGRGIAADLHRGQGMSSMKRRAKKMNGQCLVESRPGYGVVISLTVPL